MLMAGICILVMVIIIASFYPMTKQVKDDDYIQRLEKRILVLEEKLATLALTDERLRHIEVKSNKVDSFENSVNRLEATITLKTNLLVSRLDDMQLQVDSVKKTVNAANFKNHAGEKPRKKVQKKKAHPEPDYHIVRKGETFYSISRRYGISLEVLKKKNNFNEKTIIYPGQKIIIRR